MSKTPLRLVSGSGMTRGLGFCLDRTSRRGLIYRLFKVRLGDKLGMSWPTYNSSAKSHMSASTPMHPASIAEKRGTFRQ